MGGRAFIAREPSQNEKSFFVFFTIAAKVAGLVVLSWMGSFRPWGGSEVDSFICVFRK